MSVVEVGLDVVVVVAVPRGEDDAVVLRRAEVDHDVVGVSDLGRLDVDLQVHTAVTERHDRRVCIRPCSTTTNR